MELSKFLKLQDVLLHRLDAVGVRSVVDERTRGMFFSVEGPALATAVFVDEMLLHMSLAGGDRAANLEREILARLGVAS